MKLHTINASGFSAATDAFALDDDEGLWFLSMVGPQNALKAICAALLKQPPEAAWLIEGVEGAFTGEYRKCVVPYETVGTWTTQSIRLPGTGGYHAMLVTRLAEYAYERKDASSDRLATFLLLSHDEEEAPSLHYRSLDRRVSLPLHPGWAQWLWDRGLGNDEVQPLDSHGILAWLCCPDQDALRTDLSDAVEAGELRAPREETHARRNGHSHDNLKEVLEGGKTHG